MKPHEIPEGAVVVGVDASPHSDRAIDWAAQHALAEARPLVLLHASPSGSVVAGPPIPGGFAQPAYQRGEDPTDAVILEARSRRGIAALSPDVHGVLVHDDPRTALLDASRHASVVVLGSHGRGPARSLLLGSVSAAVVGRSSCPAVVVRPHHPGQVRRGVLVGVDGRADATPVLDFAFRQAAEKGLPLTVVHTVADPLTLGEEPVELDPASAASARAALALAESLAGYREQFPDVSIQRRLWRGRQDAVLLTLADAMHLVVVGGARAGASRGMGRGSVALSVLEHAATVVAVVPR